MLAGVADEHFTTAPVRAFRAGGVLLLGALVIALSPFLLAAAEITTVRDENDARGPLDVRRVDRLYRERPVFTLTSWAPWRVRRLEDRGYALVYLDTLGGRHFDYYALLRAGQRRMRATLWRDRVRQRDYKLKSLPVWRRNRRSASVRVPFAWVKTSKQRRFFFWYVQTLVASGKCPRVCLDRAPNRGAIKEPMPGRAPPPDPEPDD
jgi:hypothetical protein